MRRSIQTKIGLLITPFVPEVKYYIIEVLGKQDSIISWPDKLGLASEAFILISKQYRCNDGFQGQWSKLLKWEYLTQYIIHLRGLLQSKGTRMWDLSTPLKHTHEHKVTSVPGTMVRKLHIYRCSYGQLMSGTSNVNVS